MKNVCLYILFFILLAVVFAGATDASNLVVRTVDGNLVIIHPDGTQEQISSEGAGAVISPDNRAIAFTVVHMQQVPAPEVWRVDAKLLVMNLNTRVTTELVHPPAGTGFGQITWTPDGSAIAYELIVQQRPGTETGCDLILAPFPSERGPARNLGHWYQGFSFSPDGTQIVHAVNFPIAGLEILNIGTGTRTLLHKASNVVWDAKFSPDGKFIAYRKTVGEPATSVQDSNDDEPDCTSPNTELRLYALIDGSDTAINIAKAPLSVYNFSWSPDSRRLAIELGTEDCTSPSGDAAVFVTTVDQKVQKQISTSSPSVQPAFSPDGSAVAFVNSSQFPARLIRYDLTSQTRSVIRQASGKENDYQLLDWK